MIQPRSCVIVVWDINEYGVLCAQIVVQLAYMNLYWRVMWQMIFRMSF